MAMWFIAVLKGFSFVTSHESVEMKEVMTMNSEGDNVEEETFGMKCMFEMKPKDPRRKNWDCKRLNGAEFGKKGGKNQSSPESRNESKRVQKEADRKKMI